MSKKARPALFPLVLATRLAAAEEPPAPVPAAPPAPAPLTTDAPPPPPPTPVVDAPEIEAEYRAAFAALARGRAAEALTKFDQVAARSVVPERQATAAEVARRLREALAPAPGATPPDGTRSRSRDGRYSLLVGSTVLGLGLYGPTLPVVFEPSGDKAAVGLYMVGAGASFLVPYLATRETPVTWGMADAYWYGSTRGALHGLAVLGALDIDTDEDEEKAVFTAMALGSLAEGMAFTLWADATDASAGTTNTIGKAADLGVGFSLGLSSLALADDDLGVRWASTASLAGAAAGGLGGYYYARARNPSWGDAEVLRTAGLIGAYTGIVPLIIAESDNRHAYATLAMAGAAGGLVLGDRLLAGRRFSAGQGIVTELSALAGGLTGAGLGYLLSPDDDDGAAKIITVGALLGAVGGFALAYNGLETQLPALGSTVTVHLVPEVTPARQGLALVGAF